MLLELIQEAGRAATAFLQAIDALTRAWPVAAEKAIELDAAKVAAEQLHAANAEASARLVEAQAKYEEVVAALEALRKKIT